MARAGESGARWRVASRQRGAPPLARQATQGPVHQLPALPGPPGPSHACCTCPHGTSGTLLSGWEVPAAPPSLTRLQVCHHLLHVGTGVRQLIVNGVVQLLPVAAPQVGARLGVEGQRIAPHLRWQAGVPNMP